MCCAVGTIADRTHDPRDRSCCFPIRRAAVMSTAPGQMTATTHDQPPSSRPTQRIGFCFVCRQTRSGSARQVSARAMKGKPMFISAAALATWSSERTLASSICRLHRRRSGRPSRTLSGSSPSSWRIARPAQPRGICTALANRRACRGFRWWASNTEPSAGAHARVSSNAVAQEPAADALACA
jgi:hypothetical protein